MRAATIDKQGIGSQRQDMLCFPSPEEKRRVEEGGSGARDCKEVAELDSSALLYLTDKLLSASRVLARNTVRTSCFSLLKGKETPSPSERSTSVSLDLNI